MQRTRSTSPIVPDFTPVPRQTRKDGWTPARQRAFIAHLAATGSVTAATSEVGLSTTQAYRLRAAPGAEEFANAWDAALDCGIAALKALALDRAINGVPVTPIWRGEARETYMRHDNRLMMAMLRHYDRPLPPGTVGGAGAGWVRAQVMPEDKLERLFQNAVVRCFLTHDTLRVEEYGMTKLMYAKDQGLDFVIGVIEEQIASKRMILARERALTNQGPQAFDDASMNYGNGNNWVPLHERALVEAARIRAALGPATAG